MSKAPKEYIRLSGRGSNAQGIAVSRSHCSLWMGADHLLQVERYGFTETYKRFYYRDIQAVEIRRTAIAAWSAGILGFVTGIFAISGLAVSDSVGRAVLWTIGGVFFVFLLVDLIRGPSSVVHIKTAVQWEKLPAWKRLRTAHKGMAKLRPRILEAQGQMAVEELRAQLENRLRSQFQAPGEDAS